MLDGGPSAAFGHLPQPEADSTLTNSVVEHSLLSALLLKPELIEALPASFHPDHYFWPDHAEVHQAILAYGTPGASAVGAVMQAWAITDTERRAFVTGLFVSGPIGFHPVSVRADADIVTDLYRRRQLVELAKDLVDKARTNASDQSSEATIAQAMNALDVLAAAAPNVRRPFTLDEAMDAALKAADEAAKRDGPVGLLTGFPALDAALGGLEESTLTVVGGRPGMGKSAFGHQIAVNVARRRDVGVLVISLEMSATELGRRALSVVSGVPIWRMKQGKMHRDDPEKLALARMEMHGLPLTIEDSGGLTAAAIGLKIRAAQRRHGVGLIMVDHLHIVRPEDADVKHGATWAVGRISSAMKRMAKEYRCPVLLLAQLNRGVEGRDDKRPNLSDLRQSGDIEQDADTVGFLYRAEYYLAKEPERLPGDSGEKFAKTRAAWADAKEAAAGKAELVLAKVREGATQTIDLTFNPETASFAEAVPYGH